jgi:hypothetical protein
MAAMIAYEVLVQTIADWKAGVRPTAPIPAAPIGAPESVEELSSGVVDLDEDASFAAEAVPEDYEVDYGESSGEYDQSGSGYQVEHEPPATETYEDDETY